MDGPRECPWVVEGGAPDCSEPPGTAPQTPTLPNSGSPVHPVEVSGRGFFYRRQEESCIDLCQVAWFYLHCEPLSGETGQHGRLKANAPQFTNQTDSLMRLHSAGEAGRKCLLSSDFPHWVTGCPEDTRPYASPHTGTWSQYCSMPRLGAWEPGWGSCSLLADQPQRAEVSSKASPAATGQHGHSRGLQKVALKGLALCIWSGKSQSQSRRGHCQGISTCPGHVWRGVSLSGRDGTVPGFAEPCFAAAPGTLSLPWLCRTTHSAPGKAGSEDRR